MKINFSIQKIFILLYENIEYFFLEKIDSFSENFGFSSAGKFYIREKMDFSGRKFKCPM
jgi:hypothetical protein